MRITPKNWTEFQHYKDRDPPWIKLHKKLLDDYDFQCLPVASKALAPMLWLLASEDKDGLIDSNEVKLAFRLRMTVGELTDALMPLIQAGFFKADRDASEMLADCKRAAIPETEAQVQAETETQPVKTGSAMKAAEEQAFEEFWKAYDPPPNSKKPDARRAWEATAKSRPPQHDLLRAVSAYRTWIQEQSRKQKREYPMQHAATWLRGEVWNGYLQSAPQPFEPATDAGWHSRVRVFREQGLWSMKFGPKPGEPGCKCPPEILNSEAA